MKKIIAGIIMLIAFSGCEKAKQGVLVPDIKAAPVIVNVNSTGQYAVSIGEGPLPDGGGLDDVYYVERKYQVLDGEEFKYQYSPKLGYGIKIVVTYDKRVTTDLSVTYKNQAKIATDGPSTETTKSYVCMFRAE